MGEGVVGGEKSRTDINTHAIREIGAPFDELRTGAAPLVRGEDGEEG